MSTKGQILKTRCKSKQRDSHMIQRGTNKKDIWLISGNNGRPETVENIFRVLKETHATLKFLVQRNFSQNKDKIDTLIYKLRSFLPSIPTLQETLKEMFKPRKNWKQMEIEAGKYPRALGMGTVQARTFLSIEKVHCLKQGEQCIVGLQLESNPVNPTAERMSVRMDSNTLF